VHNLQIGSPWWKLGAVVLLLVVGLGPKNAEAIILPQCGSPMTTSTQTGFGLSCGAAESYLSSATQHVANSICSAGGGEVCSSSLTYTTGCVDLHYSNGTYQIFRSGYRTFTCKPCTPTTCLE
jgi:hypothetical protein